MCLATRRRALGACVLIRGVYVLICECVDLCPRVIMGFVHLFFSLTSRTRTERPSSVTKSSRTKAKEQQQQRQQQQQEEEETAACWRRRLW